MVHVSYAREYDVGLFDPRELDESEPRVAHAAKRKVVHHNPAGKRFQHCMIAANRHDVDLKTRGIDMLGQQCDDSLRAASAEVGND